MQENGEKTALQASEALRLDKSRIKKLWEKRIREEISETTGISSLVMINSMDIFLDELADILGQNSKSKRTAEKGMTQIHGGQRAVMAGYFLPQLLKEFSVLREIINADLHEKNLASFEVRGIIDRVIDSAISLSVEEFAKVQNARVNDALAKAQASNRELEHFASIAAHDLKSPLATISGYLELLGEEAADRLEAEHKNHIRIMSETSDRMRDLIDRLLQYASLSGTQKKFQLTEVGSVVEAVLQNLHERIITAKAKISYDPLPVVSGDADLLTQLFQNLIANGIKFAGANTPEIHISAEDKGDRWLFSVRDNGIGFDPRDKENIFALFKQLSGEKQQSGAGIGLASCRKVVELHGGKIWAESVHGGGSTFSFTLPKMLDSARIGAPGQT